MPYINIKLTSAGTDTGPFNLYSNADGYLSAFETNVTKASLLSGITIEVPVGTVMIKINSIGVCTNSKNIPVTISTTTSTTTL